MIRKIRQWLGLCEHRWLHGSNAVTNNLEFVEIQFCEKCMKLRQRRWIDRI